MEEFFLLLSLLIILFSAELFTNGIEHLGEKLTLSQAVVGSILAAIGTALPETIVPLVAILFYHGKSGAHIGVGAILGAPFMLITMGMFTIGLGLIMGSLLKKRKFQLEIEINTLKRDLFFFLISFSLAIFVPHFLPNTKQLHYLIAIFLLINYFIYVFSTFKATSVETEADAPLYIFRIFSVKNPPFKLDVLSGLLQTVLAVIIMIKGAHLFVESLEKLSLKLGLDPLLFSLILAPIATELPEKFNSFLWSMKGKDILAFGNMSGAMVFQSTFPVSVGLLFTSWNVKGLALVSALITLSLAAIYFLFVKFRKNIPPYLLFFSGLSYFVYIFLVIYSIK